MALEKTYTKFGIDFTSAYHVVGMFVRLGKERGLIWTVQVWIDDTKTEQLDSLTFEKAYDPDGGEPLTQAYTYMKTLDEYDGATDV